MHLGYNNNKYKYSLHTFDIKESNCEKILGVYIDDKLSFRLVIIHIYNCIKKASNVCNMLLTNVYNVDNTMLINLYKIYARPYLDYASVIYSPHYLQMIDIIENVQRKFTKRLKGLTNVCYVDRLNMVSLESLELRRLHCDVIMLFKILHGITIMWH